MSITIGRLALSSQAILGLARTQQSLATAIERLSSGLRINRISDDPGGLVIATKYRSDIRSISAALRNANEGISLLQIAEGGIETIRSSLSRIREIAVQASSATITGTERATLDVEVQQLLSDITRVAGATEYNGIKLLNGNLALGYVPAKLSSPTAQTQNLGQSEVLTFDGPLFEVLSTNDREVSLSLGMSQATVVSTINSSRVGQIITASIQGGVLTLTPVSSDALSSFSVKSNRSAATNTTGIGTATLVLQDDSPASSAAAAQVTAGTAQTGNLGQSETLTFVGPLFHALTSSESQVGLSLGMSQATVVSTINNSLVGKFVTASVENGNLVLRSKTDEAAGTFQVVSDRTASATSTGIGQTELVGLGQENTAQTTAKITALTAQTQNLASAEDLTFTSPLFGSIQVTIANNSSQATVVSTINGSLAGKYVTAAVEGGTLTLTAKVAGSLGTFTVESNRATGSDRAGIGQTPLVGLGQDVSSDQAQTAQVTASVAQTQPLDNAEDLEFYGLMFAGLSSNDRTVDLDNNDTQATVVSKINSSVVGKFVVASVTNGSLTLTSKIAGIEGTFYVESSKSAVSDQTGIGTTVLIGAGKDSPAPAPRPLQVDIDATSNSRIEVGIAGLAVGQLGLSGGNVLNQSAATTLITQVDNAIAKVDTERSRVGGLMARVTAATNYLTTRQDALSAAEANIMNADVAEEMASFLSMRIRADHGKALLVQAAGIDKRVILELYESLKK